jgi:hypothetical protein
MVFQLCKKVRIICHVCGYGHSCEGIVYDWCQNALGDWGAEADRDSVKSSVISANPGFEILCHGQKLCGVTRGHLSGFGQFKMVFAANKESNTKFILQSFHGSGKRRLGGIQDFGGTGQSTAFCKCFQLFHHINIYHMKASLFINVIAVVNIDIVHYFENTVNF